MLTLGEKIKEIRKEHNLNQSEFGELFGLTQNTITNIENDKRFPTYEILIEIAKRFNISVDYLLGLSEAKTNNIEIKAICDYTGLTEEAVNKLHEMLVIDDENYNINSKFINDFLSSSLFYKMIFFNISLDKLEKSLLYHLSIFFEDEKTAEKTAEKIKDELDYIPTATEILNHRELILYRNQKNVNTYFEQLTELLNEILTRDLDRCCLTVDMMLSENHTYSELSNDNLIATNPRLNVLLNKLKSEDMQKYSELKEIYERCKDE